MHAHNYVCMCFWWHDQKEKKKNKNAKRQQKSKQLRECVATETIDNVTNTKRMSANQFVVELIN